ncbi:Serine carboxypeptidase-like 51, partial [Linum perenne]
SYALKIKKQLAEGQYENATESWGELERVILDHSNHVDFYNFLYDAGDSPVVLTNKAESRRDINAAEKYTSRLISMSKRLSPKSSLLAAKSSTSLNDLMNGAIRRKLKIIPPNITLLAKNISVTIYNGQVDVICSTPGVEAWLSELKWDGLQEFLSKERTPLYCNGENSTTKAFTSSHRNLGFYWILLSGHFVPVEQPCISLQMVGTITQSPSKA